MPAEIEQHETRRQCPGHVRDDFIGEHDLAAVRGIGDPRSPVDVDADVVVSCEDRLSEMDADPHAEIVAGWPWMRRQPSLDVGGGDDRVDGRVEDREERITFGGDLDAAVGTERGTDQSLMVDEHGREPIAEVGQEASAALDVAEHEGKPPARRKRGFVIPWNTSSKTGVGPENPLRMTSRPSLNVNALLDRPGRGRHPM